MLQLISFGVYLCFLIFYKILALSWSFLEKELLKRKTKFPTSMLKFKHKLYISKLSHCPSIMDINIEKIFKRGHLIKALWYSRLSITQTHTGNWNPFELWRVQIIEINYRRNLSEGTEKCVWVMEVILVWIIEKRTL